MRVWVDFGGCGGSSCCDGKMIERCWGGSRMSLDEECAVSAVLLDAVSTTGGAKRVRSVGGDYCCGRFGQAVVRLML